MPRITIGFGGAILVESSQVERNPTLDRRQIEILAFTFSTYKTVVLKYRTSTILY